MLKSLKFFAEHINARMGRVYAVGGSVRDEILGYAPKDIDVVVFCVGYQEICNILKDMHVSFDTVGKSFGVIKAKLSEGTIDIALPRKERSTGVGHKDFEVEFGSSVTMEEDAARRDFTINAIYKNVLTGELVDPLDGVFDCARRVLRVTSREAFEDDPLRILRGIQFCARFGMRVDRHFTLGAMTEHSTLLRSVSPERVAMELRKLLVKAEKPSVGLQLMDEVGALEIVLPELWALKAIAQPAKFHNADAFHHTLRVVDAVRPDINMRVAALFHDLGKVGTKEIDSDGRITFHGHEAESARIGAQVIDALKLVTLEGFDKDKVLVLVKNHMFSNADKVSTRAVRRLVRKLGGPDMFHDLIQLRIADKIGGACPHTIYEHVEFLRKSLTIINETPAFSIGDLAVNGNDIMEVLALSSGPEVGVVLRALFEEVENDELENDREVLLERLVGFINGGPDEP